MITNQEIHDNLSLYKSVTMWTLEFFPKNIITIS